MKIIIEDEIITFGMLYIVSMHIFSIQVGRIRMCARQNIILGWVFGSKWKDSPQLDIVIIQLG